MEQLAFRVVCFCEHPQQFSLFGCQVCVCVCARCFGSQAFASDKSCRALWELFIFHLRQLFRIRSKSYVSHLLQAQSIRKTYEAGVHSHSMVFRGR